MTPADHANTVREAIGTINLADPEQVTRAIAALDALAAQAETADRLEAKLEADDEAWAAVAAELERLHNAEAARGALDDQIMAIRQAAIEHGVNDEVGAAIAHAELVARVQRRRVNEANL